MSSNNTRFTLGQLVQIIDIKKAGHVRTPFYIRGKYGRIDHDCGDFENPEERAYGRTGPPLIPLYRVRVMQNDIWEDYDGPPLDSLVLEIYDHWLRPVTPSEVTSKSGI